MPSRRRHPSQGSCPAFGFGAPLTAPAAADLSSRWRCTAQPASQARGTAAARKARVRDLLTREFPRLIARRSSAAHSFMAGGADEMFSPAVEFSFPMLHGRGRRPLKTLLWSVPLQAAAAGGMPRPCIEELRVASPAVDELDMTYVVRCASVVKEDCGPEDETCLAAASAAPRNTVLRVRTRLLFDDEGRIASWSDSWDRAAGAVVQEMLAVVEGAREKKGVSRSGEDDQRRVSSRSGDVELHKESFEIETKASERAADRDYDSWAEEEKEIWDEALEESDYAPGIAAAKVADSLPLKGKVLTAAEANVRAAEVQEFLAGEFGQLSVSSCGRPFFELLGDEPYVNFFHEGAILETPQFIVGGGPESVAMMHSLSRFNSAFQHSKAEVACLSVSRQSPRTFMATYLLRASSRFSGQLVQTGAQVKVRLDSSGTIVHCVLSDLDAKDEFFDTFSRTGVRNCVW